jgi:hypothetical protein
LALCDALCENAEKNGLVRAVEEVTNELRKYATNIDIQIR